MHHTVPRFSNLVRQGPSYSILICAPSRLSFRCWLQAHFPRWSGRFFILHLTTHRQHCQRWNNASTIWQSALQPRSRQGNTEDAFTAYPKPKPTKTRGKNNLKSKPRPRFWTSTAYIPLTTWSSASLKLGTARGWMAPFHTHHTRRQTGEYRPIHHDLVVIDRVRAVRFKNADSTLDWLQASGTPWAKLAQWHIIYPLRHKWLVSTPACQTLQTYTFTAQPAHVFR